MIMIDGSSKASLRQGSKKDRKTKKRRSRHKRQHPLHHWILFASGVFCVIFLALFNIRILVQSDLWEPSPPTFSFPWNGLSGSRSSVRLQNPDFCIPPHNTISSVNATSNEASPPKRPTGLVVTLLLGGENPQLLQGICSLFPSQLTHFIVPQQLDVLLVISGNIDVATIVQCLDLVLEQEPTSHWENLDGSNMTTQLYRVTTAIAGAPYYTKVYLSHQPDLAFPDYIQANPSLLVTPIEPPMCQAPVEYIQGTRWYTKELLHLSMLQAYDYWVKLDPDMVFLQPLDFDLLFDMQQKGAVLGHAAEYPPGVPTPCSEGIVQATQAYLSQHVSNVCAIPYPLPSSDRFYTNFLVGRTDFFQSEPVRQLGRWMSDYPKGFFAHRWTDQIFWDVSLQLYLPPSTQLARSSSSRSLHPSDSFIADYTGLRCMPLTNCWMSSLELKKYSHLDVCENGGVFVHSKHAKKWMHRWNRHLARKEPYEIAQQPLYVSGYHHDCRGTRWHKA